MSEYAEVARAESERGEVVLRRRIEENAADVLELRVNGVFVMDTRETSTEVELAAAALELVESPRRVVVGGLEAGITVTRTASDLVRHHTGRDTDGVDWGHRGGRPRPCRLR